MVLVAQVGSVEHMGTIVLLVVVAMVADQQLLLGAWVVEERQAAVVPSVVAVVVYFQQDDSTQMVVLYHTAELRFASYLSHFLQQHSTPDYVGGAQVLVGYVWVTQVSLSTAVDWVG